MGSRDSVRSAVTRSRVHRFPRPVSRPFRLSVSPADRPRQMCASTRTASIRLLRVCVRTMLPASSSRQPQFGVDAAFPVNDQDDFTGIGIDIHDDFVNECSNETFLQPDIRVRTSPDRLQVRGQMLECFSGGDHVLTSAVDVLIDARLQSRGPAARRDSSVAPIRPPLNDSRDRSHRIVSALGERRTAQPPTRASTPAGPRPAGARRSHSRPRRRRSAAGCTTRRISLAIASSTTTPPNEMQRGSPLSRAPRMQA